MKYLIFLLKHKWFVFLECRKAGITWRGIKHDLGKFRPKSFRAYRRRYNKGNDYHAINDLAYRMVFNKHLLRSDHHWQYWGLIRNTGEIFWLPMSNKARKEFLSDMRASSRHYGTDVSDWYEAHQHEIHLHLSTKKWLEEQLGFYRLGDELCRTSGTGIT